MFFLHIPKNGGSTLEAWLQPRQTVYHTWLQRCNDSRLRQVFHQSWGKPAEMMRAGWVSPWHLPPDLYRWRCGVEVAPPDIFSSRRFCVVRNPVDRYTSELHWHQGSASIWFPNPPWRLRELLAHSRFAVTWTEELVHMQPQCPSARRTLGPA